MKHIAVFFMQAFDVVHGITQGRQEPNCSRLVKNFNQLTALVMFYTVAFADVVFEITTRYFAKSVLLQVNIECILPIQQYTVGIN
jgi:hypothetical protein